ncbi:MAG TPA: FxLYD domain-containing protein [Chthonomonadaceae bacterium]|nr:FxLYD domain-containing protein [Chthonomonadaceae bacterium]
MECPNCGYVLSANEKECPLCTTIEMQQGAKRPPRSGRPSPFRSRPPLLLPAPPRDTPRRPRMSQDNIAVIAGSILILAVICVGYVMNPNREILAKDAEVEAQNPQADVKAGDAASKGEATAQKAPETREKQVLLTSSDPPAPAQKPSETEPKPGALPGDAPVVAQKPADTSAEAHPKPGDHPQPAASPALPNAALPKLQLLDKKDEIHDGSHFITGHVRNNSDQAVGYVEITFALKDAQGNVIGSAFANTNSLGAGEVWKFQATVFDDNATSFEFTDLKGD